MYILVRPAVPTTQPERWRFYAKFHFIASRSILWLAIFGSITLSSEIWPFRMLFFPRSFPLCVRACCFALSQPLSCVVYAPFALPHIYATAKMLFSSLFHHTIDTHIWFIWDWICHIVLYGCSVCDSFLSIVKFLTFTTIHVIRLLCGKFYRFCINMMNQHKQLQKKPFGAMTK